MIGIDGTRYLAHRLAFLYMTGAWPDCDVDHINLDRADNRWGNLRQATRSQNMANGKLRSSNTSGFKGVTWVSRLSKWRAEIVKDGRKKAIGHFATPECAHAAYMAEAGRVFGEYARSA